jgi:hypothetical protein
MLYFFQDVFLLAQKPPCFAHYVRKEVKIDEKEWICTGYGYILKKDKQ